MISYCKGRQIFQDGNNYPVSVRTSGPAVIYRKMTDHRSQNPTPTQSEGEWRTGLRSKQPKHPLTEEWIKKMWYIYTMEHYSAMKKKEIMPSATTWMDLKMIIPNEVRKRKTNTVWDHLHVESKKKKKNDTNEPIYKTEIDSDVEKQICN